MQTAEQIIQQQKDAALERGERFRERMRLGAETDGPPLLRRFYSILADAGRANGSTMPVPKDADYAAALSATREFAKIAHPTVENRQHYRMCLCGAHFPAGVCSELSGLD